MTSFTQIYSGTHDYLNGLVSIPNTVQNLGLAYIQVGSTLADDLNIPVLRGFLYQVDANNKRSRPYPVVSSQQTIRLDMSECVNFLFTPSNRLIDQYSINLYVATTAPSGNYLSIDDYSFDTLPDKPNTFPSLAYVVVLESNSPFGVDEHDIPPDVRFHLMEPNRGYIAQAGEFLFLITPNAPQKGDTIDVVSGESDTIVIIRDLQKSPIFNFTNKYLSPPLKAQISIQALASISLIFTGSYWCVRHRIGAMMAY